MAKKALQVLKGKMGSGLMMAVIGGFIFTSLWARFGSVEAQEKSAPKAQPTKKSAPRNFPGAGQKLDAAALAKLIDAEINKRLKEDKVPASENASDAEFLRRVYLDLVGTIPTAEKVAAFLDSKDPNKRAKVIDELLADPRFGKSLGEVWAGMMIPNESNNRLLQQRPLQEWLAEKFNSNTPLDKTVYDLLTATGPQDQNGAVTYFIGNPTVDKMTDSVTKMFLGVQLQCAQCHNHPFTGWKQTEYWAMASFFMKVRLSANPQQAAKKGVTPGISESNIAPKGKGKGLPESYKNVPAKFLQGEQPQLNTSEPYRPVLAKWVTSSQNEFFARAMVNRFWYQLYGRALVNPVDDMHDENPASHPELLAALTEQFKTNGFDVKYLIRAICNSETYQRTSRPLDGNKDDKELFSHAAVRVLSPEQLFDSLTTVVGRSTTVKGGVPKVVGKKGPGGTARDAFLAFFRIDEGADPLEYQQGIPQALRLMNSPQLTASAEAVGNAMKAGSSPAQVIERLFLTTYSRRPTADETQRMTQFVAKSSDPRTAYGDILWALLNSGEFATNH